MVKIVKSLMIILFTIPAFLDVVSMKDRFSCKKQTYDVHVYSYNGEIFEEEVALTGLYKNSVFDLSEYEDVNLDGYTFLGWCNVRGNNYYKTREELLESGAPLYLTSKLASYTFGNISWYPVLVKNEELTNFLETEEIAKVRVRLYKVIVENLETVEFTGTLLDTYEETLKFDIDVPTCTLIGCTTQYYDYNTFKKNIDKIELIDMDDVIEYTNEIVIYAYYE